MAFTALLDPVLGWLLNLPVLLALLVISALLGLISTIVQKYATDQAKMRRLKDDTKKFQKQMKAAQAEKDLDKMKKIQDKLMPLQMDMMKEGFKPMLFTMLPFLLIFFWLSSHFAYDPILPGQPFTVTATFAEGLGGDANLTVGEGLMLTSPATQAIADGRITWTLTGEEGTRDLTVAYAGATLTRQVLITTEMAYLPPKEPHKGSITSFDIGNAKVIPWPGFKLFGWQPGWIFWYIAFSIPISLGLKKLLRVV